jgi:hypothetical protein
MLLVIALAPAREEFARCDQYPSGGESDVITVVNDADMTGDLFDTSDRAKEPPSIMIS